MTGAEMNQLFCMMQGNMQMQKNSAVKALGKERGEPSNFSQFMKVNSVKTTKTDTEAANVQKFQEKMEQTTSIELEGSLKRTESAELTESTELTESVEPTEGVNLTENAEPTEIVKTAECVDSTKNNGLKNEVWTLSEQKYSTEAVKTDEMQTEPGIAVKTLGKDAETTSFLPKQIQLLNVSTEEFGNITVCCEIPAEIFACDAKSLTNKNNQPQQLLIQMEVPEKIQETLEEIKNHLVKKIAESFGVSEDDVVESMETLAVSVLDLLQTDNLKELAVAISGEESKVSLVTNEAVLQNYQMMVTGIQETLKTLSAEQRPVWEKITSVLEQAKISLGEFLGEQNFAESEKLEQLVSDSKVELEVTLKLPETDQKSVTVFTESSSEVLPKMSLETVMTQVPEPVEKEAEPLSQMSVAKDIETLPDKTEVVNQPQQEKLLENVAKEGKSLENIPLKENSLDDATQQETVAKDSLPENSAPGVLTKESTAAYEEQQNADSQQRNAQSKTGGETKSAPVIQNTTNFTTITTDNQVQTIVRTQESSFEGIVKQIVEQVKVEFKPDTVSMELQLTPESLGKVNLHVSSKEGAVTAELFVQNEAVKHAIESQLLILRETMQQQGIKVEAVEVTVQTGEFGRSLEQNSEQHKKEAENQSKSYQKKGINLLQGLDEESMTEEELLRAHIMQESGNSVDMNA